MYPKLIVRKPAINVPEQTFVKVALSDVLEFWGQVKSSGEVFGTVYNNKTGRERKAKESELSAVSELLKA